MVPLYRLTGEKCNFCTYFVTGALWLLRLPQFWPHFTTGPPNGLPYSLILEIAIFWPHFTTGPLDGPPYSLIVEMAIFWHHFVIGSPNGPLYRLIVEIAVFALFCHSATKWSTIQADWWKVQFLVLISQWVSKWPPYKADCLTVLFQWPWNGQFKF